MASRGVLSPLTNTPTAVRHLPESKYVSPSTRRQPGLCSTSSPSVSLLNEAHDDEKERRDRRRSRILELQRNFGTSPSSPSDRRTTPLSGLTSAQLAEHYSNCIQLSTENKINAKNAFGLHLIDYMTELLKKKELENFQVASSTLDASAKIYAGRVDFIHSETYKVLSGLGRGSSKQQSNDGVDEGEEVVAADNEEVEEKKKRVRKSRTTETNLKNFTVHKFDLEFEVMSATFDEGGASGLLLNHLRSYNDSQLLVLDSSAVMPIVDEQAKDSLLGSQSYSQHKPLDISEVTDLIEKMSLASKEICPAFRDFKFTGWDGTDMSYTLPKRLSEFAFDPSAEPAGVSAAEDDIASLPGDIDPLDLRDISDTEADDDGGADNALESFSQLKGDTNTADFIQNAFSELTQGNTGKLMQILATQPTDYSYFNKVIMRTWAGPSHWKTAPMSRDPSFRTLNSKSEKSKPRRAPFQLTYEGGVDFESKFKASKATALTRATLQKYCKKRTTLPEDLHFQADKLFRLFHRQKIMIKRQTADAIGVEDSIENYNYDNANDRENYCPDVGCEGDDDTPELGFNFSEDSQGLGEASHSQMSQPGLGVDDSGLNATSLTGDKLLSQPYKVAKIDISYAKTAKRLDVQKLKRSMWSVLTSASRDLQTQDSDSNPLGADGTSCGKKPAKEMKEIWTFQALLRKLLMQVSGETARNLSVPIAFVCLLHLANEKTLKIADQDMANLTIDQDI